MDSDSLLSSIQSLLLGLVGMGAFVLAVWALGKFGILWIRMKNRAKQGLEYVLLQIAVPSDNEIKIDAAEQMIAALYSVKVGGWWKNIFYPQPTISFEIVAKKEDIRFYICLPNKLKDIVERQIHGAYPGAEVEEVQEYNIFDERGQVAFAEIQLRKPFLFPLKTYKDLPTDPMSAITTALAKMGEGEGAAIQIVISPADNKWRSSGRGYVADVKKTESDPNKAKYNSDPKDLEAIENKSTKPGFETSIRVVVSAPTKELAKANLANIKSVLSQFESNLNGLKSRKYILIKRASMINFLYRYQPLFYFLAKKSILNSEELATIFHFPNKQILTPHIHWVYAKRAPAPVQIPREGMYLGKSTYRGLVRPVFISEGDRRRHIYIIGKTGVGKTVLMQDMILQDVRAGRGICLIDPHDLADDILKFIPPERAEDVIYFDPSDTERPMGLNLLEAKTEQQQHFIASSIINLMYKLYDPYKTGIIGPRFEHAIRNAMLTVMCEPGSTFVEVMRCLQDPNFVKELLPKVKDPIVRRYWTDQIAQTSDFHKSEVLDYIVSKFGRFVTDKMMRNIIGQSKSSFDFREVMDQGKILIINLSKGKIGEENSNFLGLVLVPKILMAAMSRSDIPESARRDFYLYVDEFQNFATPDFAQILSEARKYRLSLCVANQFIGQMEEEVKNAVFGNVGTVISFRVGVSDANYLQHEFQPVFAEDDLVNIERFHAYIKTLVNVEPVPPFSMDLTKDLKALEAQANPRAAELIKQLSRLKYGRDRDLVEMEITRRARL